MKFSKAQSAARRRAAEEIARQAPGPWWQRVGDAFGFGNLTGMAQRCGWHRSTPRSDLFSACGHFTLLASGILVWVSPCSAPRPMLFKLFSQSAAISNEALKGYRSLDRFPAAAMWAAAAGARRGWGGASVRAPCSLSRTSCSRRVAAPSPWSDPWYSVSTSPTMTCDERRSPKGFGSAQSCCWWAVSAGCCT